MTAAEHYRAARQRILASDYQWQDGSSDTYAAGSVREAVLAVAHATLALIEPQAQDEVVDATIYCGHDGCGLPDGHLSACSAGDGGGRTWTDEFGDLLTVGPAAVSSGTALGVTVGHKDGLLYRVWLSPAQAREVADDLRARAAQLDAEGTR